MTNYPQPSSIPNDVTPQRRRTISFGVHPSTPSYAIALLQASTCLPSSLIVPHVSYPLVDISHSILDKYSKNWNFLYTILWKLHRLFMTRDMPMC